MEYCCAFRESFLIEQIVSSDEAKLLERAYELFEKGDSSRAHTTIQRLVDEKHPLALVLASMFSRDGETDEQFHARHLAQLQTAATMRSSLALYSLGVYTDVGEFLDQDKQKAFKYFREAADLGMPQAMHIYGIMLYYGTGGAEKDSARGLSLVQSAAASNVEEAKEFLRSIGENL